MLGTVAVTDEGWYRYLAHRGLSEVNFWNPSPRTALRAPEFSPFFFKLRAPHRAIAGFGFVARWSALPVWLAWETFGDGNGCASLEELSERVARIRAGGHIAPQEGVDQIGCTLLVQPVFFAPDRWVRQPADWADQTVSNKRYDLTTGEGARIWQECQERIPVGISSPLGSSLVLNPQPRYGTTQLVTPRLGQGTFRIAVLDAYGRACAATNEHSLPVLEAAHIKAYRSGGPHDTRNGLLLRADIHKLFDKGYVTVTPDLRFEVSPRSRHDYGNGKSYDPIRGRDVQVPDNPAYRPDPDFLRWHNEQIFRG